MKIPPLIHRIPTNKSRNQSDKDVAIIQSDGSTNMIVINDINNTDTTTKLINDLINVISNSIFKNGNNGQNGRKGYI